MSAEKETFFTVVGCMDGRVQEPVMKFGQEKFEAKYPDTITEPGIVGILSSEHSEEFDKDLKKKLLISIDRHGSKGIIVDGHNECAGNPVDVRNHKENTIESAEAIKELVEDKVEVIPVFVDRNEEGEWVVEEL